MKAVFFAHGLSSELFQARFESGIWFKGNADLVGAINVITVEHARLTCAETLPAVRTSGQEPTETT